MYKLIFFVPIENAESVKNAVFAAGAGRLGHYSQCSFETVGTGQFLPNSLAHPQIGQINRLTRITELRVEILCAKNKRAAVTAALCHAHPYEKPAYEWYPIEIDDPNVNLI